MTVSRSGRVVLFAAVLAICGILIVYAVDGRVALEKIALRLATPVGLLWCALALQAAHFYRRGRRAAAAWSLALFSAVTLLGNGSLAGRIVARAEEPFLKGDPLSAPACDAVILLGGGSSTGLRNRPQLNGAGDRLLLAAQMYHAGKTRRLICTGQHVQQLNPGEQDPAEQARWILESVGIPRADIQLSGGRNTAEELKNIAELAGPGERLGLLTSAWHMSRALRLAEANGLDVIPVPADFRGRPPDENESSSGPGALVLSLIPAAEAMVSQGMMWKEGLASLVGR